jgi:predicted dehydrogenase
MYIDEIKHFLKCVKNRRKTINNLDDGINTMNIALAIKKSGRSKKIIKID